MALCGFSSITYSVVVNGQIGENFTPTRGLCHGDPLSPHLFLICEEGLSSLLRMVLVNGQIRGVACYSRSTFDYSSPFY